VCVCVCVCVCVVCERERGRRARARGWIPGVIALVMRWREEGKKRCYRN